MKRRTSATAVTTAGAAFPLRRQLHLAHRRGDAEQDDGLQEYHREDHDDLPDEVRGRWHRGTFQALEDALLALDGDLDRERLERGAEQPDREYPGHEVLREAQPALDAVADHLGEEQQQDDREAEREDDRL